MTDLTITEAYYLCAIKNKGKIKSSNAAQSACLITAMLYELEQYKVITLNKDDLLITSWEDNPLLKLKMLPGGINRRIEDETPEDLPDYLSYALEAIKKADSQRYKDVMRTLANSWTDWHMSKITVSLGDDLTERKFTTKAKMGVFTNNRTYYFPAKDTLPILAAELTGTLTGMAWIPEEEAMLWFLLEEADCIPAEVEASDREEIHRRVHEEIARNPDGIPARMKRLEEKLQTSAVEYTMSSSEYYKHMKKRD